MEAKCIAGKFKTPKEIGLTPARKTYAVFTHIENIRDSWRRNTSLELWSSAELQSNSTNAHG